ncbi:MULTISPECIES: DUF6498-containing protein [Halorussus]|uniref:DUF6498-containing protein n=1 Tax=Halorussus TaxID=1070314 RepID=UPI000E212E47|nr:MULTISPECIES: DUF6498-containing protein [Halorussus]NHN58415.1 hypothetical protein [Halorussus sp. JP-T4]
MSARRYGDILPTELGFLPVLLTNLPPLVGVLWFDWNPETLVAVYALELLVMFPLAGAKALFAGRPPVSDRESGVFSVSESELVDKRGSVTIHDRLPPMYPRNVPFVTAVVSGGAWICFFIVATVSEVVAVTEIFRRPEVLTSVAALVVGQLVETANTYIGSDQYADHSPYAVVETPARQGFFLAFLLLVVTAGGPTVVLAGFVLVKVLFEWSGFRAESDGGGRITGWFSGPESDSTVDSLDVPGYRPSATVDVDRRAVAAAAVRRGVTTVGPLYVTMTTVIWVGTIGVLTEGTASLTLWVGVGLVALLLFVLMLAGEIVEDVLASGWMTYRRIGDRLVAYDRLTDDPQWVAPVGGLRDAAVVETRPSDRYFGTRTVTVTAGWGDDKTERTLGPVSDPERLVETFELPVGSTELPPLDRRFASAAVGSVALMAVAGVVLVVTPLGPSTGWLFVVFCLPFLTIVPKGLWRLAHP